MRIGGLPLLHVQLRQLPPSTNYGLVRRKLPLGVSSVLLSEGELAWRYI